MKYITLLLFASITFFSCTTKKKTPSFEDKVSVIEMPKPIEKSSKVISLPSGLKYKIIKRGTGNSPRINSKVRAHYHGTLEDGTVFDSSYDRGAPLVFTLNQVIKGWQEGLQLMKEGGIWELYIPPNLGYGSRPAGKIPPFSNLTFKVELLEIL